MSKQLVIIENGELENGLAYSRFKDYRGNVVSVQDSSLAYPPVVRLEGNSTLLTKQQAKTLIRILQRFVDTETVSTQ